MIVKKRKIVYLLFGLYVCISALTGCATHTVWTGVGKYKIELSNNSLKARIDKKGDIEYQYDAVLIQNNFFLSTEETEVHIKDSITHDSIERETLKYNQTSFSAQDVYRPDEYLPVYNTPDKIYPEKECVIVTWVYRTKYRELYGHSSISESPYIYIPIDYAEYREGIDAEGSFERIILPIPQTESEWWRIPVCLALTPFSVVADAVTLPIQLIIGIRISDSFKNI